MIISMVSTNQPRDNDPTYNVSGPQHAHEGDNMHFVLIAWENGEVTIEPTPSVRMGLTSGLEYVPTQ